MNSNGVMPFPNRGGDFNAAIPTIPVVIKSIADCVAYCQKQETARTAITAKRDVAIQMIQSRQESLSMLLDHRFNERDKLFSSYFQVVEEALKAGNDEILKDVLQSILAVYGNEVTAGSENIRTLLEFKGYTEEDAA